MQLQVHKLTEANSGLKTRVSLAQDENFLLLQKQQEELDRKEAEVRSLNERIKRLERELADKGSTVNSLEDKTTVLQNRNTRLENECSNYQKERKSLVGETEELKREVKKTLQMLMGQEDLVQRLKTAHSVQEKEWENREKWLNERNEQLTSTVEELLEKLEVLEMENSELEMKIGTLVKGEVGLAAKLERSQRHSLQGGAVMFAAGQHSFELDNSSDDIQAELLAAQVEKITASNYFRCKIKC